MGGVTSADVARESGVSRTTVSYVLNDTAGVTISLATRVRVRDAALRLGYTPSAAARALRTGHTDLVLCVLPDWPLGPAIDTLLDQLTATLAERDLSLLVHHGGARRTLADLWRTVTPRAVVGFTAFTAAEREAMERAGVQVLSTLLEVDPTLPDSFSVSQSRVGRLQVAHLVAAGHRRIGYAAPTDPRLGDFHGRRLAGVRDECAERGLPAPAVQPVGLDLATAAAAVGAWRGGADPVTAVAAYNDEVALAVLAGVRAQGLEVPADLAVIGVDDIPAARLAWPALTTVSQSLAAQARYLGATVLAALDGTGSLPPRPTDVLEIVRRDST